MLAIDGNYLLLTKPYKPYKIMFYMGVVMNYVKKTIELDEKAVKKVRKIFDVKTDKEAVNQALRWVAEENDIIEAHQSLSGKADLEDVFS